MFRFTSFLPPICIILISLLLLSCNQQKSTDFPSIKLFVSGGVIQDEQKVDCSIELRDRIQQQTIKGGIEYRGSSSKLYPKKSYTVRFKNEKAIQWQGLSLIGDWVLYAPYADRSCIRNTLAQYFFSAMGHYSTSSVFTELYINNEYMGVYELREKIDLDKPGLKEAKCILKIDKTTGKKKQKFASVINPDIAILEHDVAKGFEFNAAIQKVHDFEKALLDTTKNLSNYADMDSFVDYFLFSEFANSPDAYRSSCYFTMLKDQRIAMGPIWDYDLAFGNSTLYKGLSTQGWRYAISETQSPYYTAAPKWWSNLYRNKSFKTAVSKRWAHLRQSLFSAQNMQRMVDRFADPIQPALANNFKKWPIIGKQVQWAAPPRKSYKGELDYLKQWMVQRANWMDTEIGK
jgi:spore coat protein CotH